MTRKKTRRRKLPNGFGSIVKRTRNGKDEYRVYAPGVYDPEIKDYYQEPLARVESYNDGYKILLKYHENPYEVENKDITFGLLCEKTIELAQKDCDNNKMSRSNLRSLKGANNKLQMDNISKIKVLELKFFQLQIYLDSLNLGYTSKSYQINLFNRAFAYAKNYFEINIIIDTSELDIGKKLKSTLYKPIEDHDIKLFWNHRNRLIGKIILISLYTGIRPSEILEIKNINVFLDDNYMIGGMKTEAGTNRVIPIHHLIKPIIEELYDPNNKYLISENGNQKPLKKYEEEFKEFMIELGLESKEYLPYCTRHTFATKADECGFKEAILKTIIGHSLKNDVTNSVYIHRKKELIINEIEKLKYDIDDERLEAI